MRLALAAAVVLLTACRPAGGPYPAREIKLIVQASPGGLSDTISRITATFMEKKLGVPVICENKPGAAGALAFSYVTRQRPDGYVIGHAPVEIAMVRTLGYADVGPDNMDLLCLLTKSQPAVAVRSDAPWKTLREFLEAAAARPGRFVVANSGTGSIWHINALLLERSAKVQFVHCPFNGSTGALTTLIGGHVDAAVAGTGEIAPHVKAGRLRVLTVLDGERSTLFPEVPSSTEEGYAPGLNAWSGFFGPKGMSGETRRLLVDAIRVAFEAPEFRKVCEERGMDPEFLDAGQFGAFAAEQASIFAATIPTLLRGSQ